MQEKQFDYVSHYRKDGDEFDYFTQRTGATEHDERRLRQYILSLFPKKARTVLDVGAGSAWVARELCEKGISVTSVDLSMNNVRTAQSLYPHNSHSQLVADAFRLPVKDNAFDCIIASEIIEHVPDPDAFTKELFRVVKPGGMLIITTPYKEILQYSLCIHCNKKTPLHAHIHSFDESALLSHLSDFPNAKAEVRIFGNKALIFLRTYVLLKYFPFQLWKFLDTMANVIVRKKAHLLIKWSKH